MRSARAENTRAKKKIVKSSLESQSPSSSAQSSPPELFFGLVGAVGTDLEPIFESLRRELLAVNYSAEEIRLSSLLADCDKYSELRNTSNLPEHERITRFMNAGDDFRGTAKRGDAVTLLGMGRARDIREELSEDENATEGRAFIFNSLKHPEEVDVLRRVYGQAFFLISVYESRENRHKNLCERSAQTSGSYDPEPFSHAADALIDRDQKDLVHDLGQNVRDTFPRADLFVSVVDGFDLEVQVKRFIRLLFGYPFTTPTIAEYAMFHAKAAALRSADLSRQVGAVIASSSGEILASGCNEVPAVGGGSVWDCEVQNGRPDNRDFVIGYDSSVRMAHELIAEVFSRLQEEGWLSPERSGADVDELAQEALRKGEAPPLKGTRAASIIEFGRIVHAEMAAVCDAARRGVTIKDATLYCTTFPCHMCARHLIAAGLIKVVYIEPYPKSLAKELYARSIRLDYEAASAEPAVEFVPFTGVAPRRYLQLFETTKKRKDDAGRAMKWKATAAMPKVAEFSAYKDLEAVHLDLLETNKKSWGIITN